MIAVLCVRGDSVYKNMKGTECYDAHRNAFSFNGDMPVVAHPPCRLWSQLSYFANSPDPEREKELARHCVRMTRKNGGVLEHPAYSKLWSDMDLPRPDEMDFGQGWCICVNQHDWGHRGRKPTWLYFYGIDRESVILPPVRGGKMVLHNNMNTREREATPVEFARWLLGIAETARRRAVIGEYRNP